MAKAKNVRAKARAVSEKFDVGRSAIQLSILGLLQRGEMCGYKIAKELREKDEALKVQYGVLYPLLERMEGQGLLKGHWEEGRGQNGLHVYQITAAGRKSLAESQAVWLRLVSQVRSIIGARA
jgi:DNA-binding PadR family transcriptional regulator